jgi:ribosomal protein L11 methyltransferase
MKVIPAPARSDSTVVARLSASEATARHLVAVLGESFDATHAVVGAFEGAAGDWQVTIDFREPPNQTAVRALVALASDPEAANALVFETVAVRDWVSASLAGLAPVDAGRFVVHGGHDRARIGPNRIGIEIEAALAFGTGHHGTTRGCLKALDAIAKTGRPRTILDVGTGSGVLAIAAARALRRPVLASDIDITAVRAARENARRNRAGAAVTIIHAAGVGARPFRARAPFDLVFANILLGPLKGLARPIRMLTTRGTRLVLSGLLPAHANAALAAYRSQGFALQRRTDLDGWTTLMLRRGVAARRRHQ